MLYIIKSNSEDISKLKAEKVDRSEILNFATIDNVREMIKEAIDWHLGCWDDPGNTDPEDPDIAAEEYVRKEHIVLNTAKANGSLDYITDLDDDYILIEFNQKKNQSYWFGSPS